MNEKTKSVITILMVSCLLFTTVACHQNHQGRPIANDNITGKAKPVDPHPEEMQELPVSVRLHKSIGIEVEKTIGVSLQNNFLSVKVEGTDKNDKPIMVEVQKTINIESKNPLEVKLKNNPLPVKLEAWDDKDKPITVQVKLDGDGPLEVRIKSSKWKAFVDTFNSWANFGKTIVDLLSGPSLWTVIAAFATFRAAKAAHKSANAAEKTVMEVHTATEAQLYVERMMEYGSSDMLKSMNVLFRWSRTKEGKDLIKKLAEETEPNLAIEYIIPVKVNEARRYIKMYFESVLQLCQSSYKNKHFLQRICTHDNLVKIGKIILVLEKALILIRGDSLPEDESELTPFSELRNVLKKENIKMMGQPEKSA